MQTSLFQQRQAPRFAIHIALMCASLAWAGWMFQRTVGDPHRLERIATAILKNPDARSEIAGPLTEQLVTSLNTDAQTKKAISDVIAAVLADPKIIDNLTAALGSAQANALGVADPRPTIIDVGELTRVVHDRLAATNPELAAQIPVTDQKIELPRVSSPAIKNVRGLADTWTVWLGLIAALGFVALMVFGDRRATLRAYGFWAIFTGAFWAIGPRILPWLVGRGAPQADGLVRATVNAVAGPITLAATLLVIFGVVAFVVRATFFRTEPAAVGAGAPAGGTFAPDGTFIAPNGMIYAPAGRVPHRPHDWHTAPPPTGQHPYETSPYSAPYPTGAVAYPAAHPSPSTPYPAGYPSPPMPYQVPTETHPAPYPQAVPFTIRPFDATTSNEILFPLTQPEDPRDSP